MDWKLEVVVIPVTDVDRAKRFYADKVGFNLDHDVRVSDAMRIVQLTPSGSACSIVLGTGIANAEPGSVKGLQLVVPDIVAAHAELVERGVEVSPVQVFDSGSFRPSREGDTLDNEGFVFFSDPDGNGWSVQQIRARD